MPPQAEKKQKRAWREYTTEQKSGLKGRKKGSGNFLTRKLAAEARVVRDKIRYQDDCESFKPSQLPSELIRRKRQFRKLDEFAPAFDHWMYAIKTFIAQLYNDRVTRREAKKLIPLMQKGVRLSVKRNAVVHYSTYLDLVDKLMMRPPKLGGKKVKIAEKKEDSSVSSESLESSEDNK